MGACGSTAAHEPDQAPDHFHHAKRGKQVAHGMDGGADGDCAWSHEESETSQTLGMHSVMRRMALGHDYAPAPATSFSDASSANVSSINPSFVAHIHAQMQQQSSFPQAHQQAPNSQHPSSHSAAAPKVTAAYDTNARESSQGSMVQQSAVVFSYRASTSSYTRRVQTAHQLAQSQLQQLLKQAQSLLPSGHHHNVVAVLPLPEPVDCTELEEYYDEERPDYADYVRRWEEAKEIEQRALHEDAPIVERSLFFGLAEQHALEAAKLMQSSDASIASTASSAASSPQPLLTLTLGPYASANTHASDNVHSGAASPLPHSVSPVSPRELVLDESPADNHLGIRVSPVLQGVSEQALLPLRLPKHIAQTSVLAFMNELIAENNAIAQANAEAAAAEEEAQAAARAAATSSYLAALQSSSARSVGHASTAAPVAPAPTSPSSSVGASSSSSSSSQVDVAPEQPLTPVAADPQVIAGHARRHSAVGLHSRKASAVMSGNGVKTSAGQ